MQQSSLKGDPWASLCLLRLCYLGIPIRFDPATQETPNDLTSRRIRGGEMNLQADLPEFGKLSGQVCVIVEPTNFGCGRVRSSMLA